MPSSLPRVTYSNTGTDFSPVHDRLDQLIPIFEAEGLGRSWTAKFASGPSYSIISPIDGALLLGAFPTSTVSDIRAAIAAASAARGAWSASSLEDRLDFASRWEEALAAEKYNLALAALYEIGKSRIEAVGEAEECLDMVAYYRSELELRNGYAQPMNELVRNETTRSVLRPYGVFGVISPFNFPLALSINMICGALLTGNTVVYKPSRTCALTGLMLADTLKAAGLPQGVFNIVIGGRVVGETLVSSADVDGIAFTGSYETGMGIFRQLVAQDHAKPLIADMGGKNPAYVSRNADIAVAAEGVARSAFGLQGQKCSACSVVYVDRTVKDEFVSAIKAFAATLHIGDPRAREQFMGPLYDAPSVARFTAAVEEARSRGVVHFGGKRLEGLTGNYFTPAIVELGERDRLTNDELFMPFLVIRPVDDLQSGIEEGNDVNYGLSAGVYSRDQAEIDYFLAHAQAGVLYANRASGATTGAWPGFAAFLRVEGVGRYRQGRARAALFAPVHARAEPHRDAQALIGQVKMISPNGSRIGGARAVTTETLRFAPYWWDAATPVASQEVPLPRVADVVVVGSGFTGLRAALVLARRGREVVVVDREDPGSGAARRNAGFLGRVLKKSFIGLQNSRGLPHAIRVYRELDDAYQTLMNFITEEQIDCLAARDGRFVGATSPAHYELLARELGAVNKHLDLPYAMIGRQDVRTELATDIYHGGATIPDLGSLHPGLYHQGLLDRAAAAGVLICGRTDVMGIVRQGGPYRFSVTTTAGNVAARDVVVTTNGYTTARLGWWSRRVIPFQGYMAATEELAPELVRKIIPHRRVVIDTNTDIDFFRPAPDSNRILLGGATAGGMQSADEIALKMHAIMARVLPDLRQVKLSHVWTGFCAGTFDLMPHAGGRDGLWHAMGYNFAGVTMGSYLGHKIGHQILGDPKGQTVFSQDRFPTMPFYRGKPWFLPAAMKYFDWKDKKTARTPLGKLKAH